MSDLAFRLYWWRRKERWSNLGDEVSPLILRHVTGREVEHADYRVCPAKPID